MGTERKNKEVKRVTPTSKLLPHTHHQLQAMILLDKFTTSSKRIKLIF